MFITPKVPLDSFRHHIFADKRNFMGIIIISHSLFFFFYLSLSLCMCNNERQVFCVGLMMNRSA